MSHDEENEHPLVDTFARIMLVEVTRLGRVTPNIVEVTLAGADLAAMPRLGPDAFVYVFPPRNGSPGHPIARDFSWDAWRALPEADRPVGRYYTIRRHRPRQGEVDLHMVLHGEGPLAEWAGSARRGDPVGLWGPRAAFQRPPRQTSFLLASDEAGLPALAAILESLGPEAAGQAIIEASPETHTYPLDPPPGLAVRWLPRNGEEHGSLLREAVAATSLPPPPLYAWAAAEAAATTAIRRDLKARGLSGKAICAVGYWHHQAT
jgi:NADPH-dependent ferric siderophore reductase